MRKYPVTLFAVLVCGAFVLFLLPNSLAVQAAPWTPTPSGQANAGGACVIPDSGPWPPCASGNSGGGSAAAPAKGGDSAECVIPTSGPWPPCASAGGAKAAPATGNSGAPASGGCVIPKTGPWPACATSGNSGAPASGAPAAPSNPAPPAATATPAWDNSPDYTPPTNVKFANRKMSELDLLGLTTRVVVKGRVVSAESFSRGYKFYVNDGTGTGLILIWSSVYDDMQYKNVLNVGAEVVVQGVIDRFEGKTQVVPLFGDAVQVTKPAGMSGREVKIADLGKYVNQRVMVDGRIQRIETNQYGTEIIFNDGTGDAEIFMWSNNYDRTPDKWQMKPGMLIRAVGKVDEYRGNFTITPALPYDVQVRRQ